MDLGSGAAKWLAELDADEKDTIRISDGSPWFVAKDVCHVLSLDLVGSNASRHTRMPDVSEKQTGFGFPVIAVRHPHSSLSPASTSSSCAATSLKPRLPRPGLT